MSDTVRAPADARALHVVALMLAVAAVAICAPMAPALILAAWTAALLRPLLVRLARVVGGQRRAAAALSLLLLVVLVVPLVVMAVVVGSGARDLAASLAEAPSVRVALQALVQGSVEVPSANSGPFDLAAHVDDLLVLLQRHGAQAWSWGSRIMGATLAGLIGVFLYFSGVYAFLVDGRAAWAWVEARVVLPRAALARFASAFHETGRGLLFGVVLTMATQGLVATIAYALLDVPRAWVLGPLTGLASLLPVVGSSLVWGPIALALFAAGHVSRALVLLALGAGVISTVDNLLRPTFARMGALRMPTFALFIAIFGGLASLGAWGALLGPLVVRLAMEAMSIARALPTTNETGAIAGAFTGAASNDAQEPR